MFHLPQQVRYHYSVLICCCFPFFLLAQSSLHQPSTTTDSAYWETLIFPLQQEHVHGPTIVELPNGDLLTAWFQGSGERWADDVRIMGARLIKGDTIWSEPFLMADKPGFPDINPMLFLDPNQRLWLMWYPVIANQWETSLPMYRISEDYEQVGAPVWHWQDVLLVKAGDKTERGIQPGDRFVENVQQQLGEYEAYFTTELLPHLNEEEQRRLLDLWDGYKRTLDSLANGKNVLRRGRLLNEPDQNNIMLGYPLSRRIGWQTKNKPFILDRRIIVPLYSDGLDCSLFAITDDLGAHWQFSNPVIGGIGIQPTIAQDKNGHLHAYLRDNGPAPQRMQHTISKDGGLSWSIAKDDQLPNPGAGFDMTMLDNGEWMMAYNHSENSRADLSVAISEDEGESWSWRKSIEHDERKNIATRSHYPAIIQGKEGRIHVVYSFHHNDRMNQPHKSIKYASFELDWVKEK